MVGGAACFCPGGRRRLPLHAESAVGLEARGVTRRGFDVADRLTR